MEKYEYEELLERARAKIPPEVFESTRFKIPKVLSFTEGNRTIIQNFKDINSTLNRKPEHLSKFLSRELATAGTIEETTGRIIFQGRFSESAMNTLIKRYTEMYVLCPECKKPDTKIKKEDRFFFLECEACGARASLKPL